MKRGIWCGLAFFLVACGGQTEGESSSSSSASSGSGSSSSSSSSSGNSSSSSSSSGGDVSTPPELTNVVWELRYLQNNVGIQRASAIPITLNFNVNRTLDGSTACGSFATNYWIRHSAMGFNDAPQLPVECAPSPWALLEQDYYAALNSIAWFEVDATTLELTSGDDTVLVFEPVGPRCESPKPVFGDSAPALMPPWPPVHVLLTSEHPIEPLIQQLETEYPDLELRAAHECGPGEITVAVNRGTLEYLRCRNDISTITYQ